MAFSSSETEKIKSFLKKGGVNLSPPQMKQLEIYSALIVKWTKKINLIAPSTIPQLIERHLLDSAQLFIFYPDLFSSKNAILDIGSGAGFPGMVLAILSGAQIDLVDSDTRKTIFLKEVKRELELKNVQIHAERITSFTKGREKTYDLVTARALAPLEKLLEWGSVFLKNDGNALFAKGQNAKEEITKANKKYDFSLEIKTSMLEKNSHILHINHIKKIEK